jgi:hypothetical protein
MVPEVEHVDDAAEIVEPDAGKPEVSTQNRVH